ncbi:hypothetical protein Tsubulata_004626, partial [Turnera subulata]
MADIASMVLGALRGVAAQQVQKEVELIFGAKKGVKKLAKKLEAITDGLVVAEKTQLQEDTIKHWLDRLKDVAYDIEDIVDEWNTALWRSKVAVEGPGRSSPASLDRWSITKKVKLYFSLFCNGEISLSRRRDTSLRILDLNASLKELAQEKAYYNFSDVKFTAGYADRPMTVSLVDASKFMSKNERIYLDAVAFRKIPVSPGAVQARHLMTVVQSPEDAALFAHVKNLRSLLVKSVGNCPSTETLNAIIRDLTCLRALKMDKASLKEIPKKVSKLAHLRYLDLSYNPDLKELPESICKLVNLQTLDVSFCSGLEKLPSEIWKLVNLRHLRNSGAASLASLPKGITGLTNLRTLSEFAGTEAAPKRIGNKRVGKCTWSECA